MKGHIRQLGPDRWQVMYDLAPDPVTGKRRQRSQTVRGGRKEAEAILAAVRADLAAGIPPDDRTATVARLADLWLEARRTQLRPSTITGYRQKLRYVTDLIGHRKITQLSGGLISALYSRLLDRGLSARSVMHVHRVLRRMLADAVRWGYLRTNPADAADPPTPIPKEMATWTREQLEAFIARWSDDRWFPAWQVLATTAIRRGELSGLRWEDLAGDVLEVRRSMSRRDGKLETGPPKTAAGRRRVALDESTVNALARWRIRQLEERMRIGPDWHDGGWIFTMPDGRPVDPDHFTHRWVKMVKATPKLSKIRLHDLRHTWATLAIEAGVPAKVVAERLGHASVSVTLDVYTHRVDELHRQAAEKVSRLMGF